MLWYNFNNVKTLLIVILRLVNQPCSEQIPSLTDYFETPTPFLPRLSLSPLSLVPCSPPCAPRKRLLILCDQMCFPFSFFPFFPFFPFALASFFVGDFVGELLAFFVGNFVGELLAFFVGAQ